jgi:hypothetical protein
MLGEVYGKVAMRKTQVYEWHKRFRDGLETVDDLRCRQPSTSSYGETIERMPSVVQSDY